MALSRVLGQQLLFGALVLALAAASESNQNCNSRCGSLSIPYPFGTRETGCYLDPSFLIICNHTFNPPKPFLATDNIEVLNISLDGEVRVPFPVARYCGAEASDDYPGSSLSLVNSAKFPVSHTKNKFVGLGCQTVALIGGEFAGGEEQIYETGCLSFCYNLDSAVNGSCKGIGCCESFIAKGMSFFDIYVTSNISVLERRLECGIAFLVEESYNFSTLDAYNFHNRTTAPVLLDWAVGNETCLKAKKHLTNYACKAEQSECYNSIDGPGYRCNCSLGYQGNPYLPNGCRDTDECSVQVPSPCVTGAKCVNTVGGFRCKCPKGQQGDGKRNGTGCAHEGSDSKSFLITALCISMGLLILFTGGFSIYLGLKRRQLIKLREKLFQQNGGLMLQQQLSNYRGSEESTKIFGIEELKRATNNYDQSRIIGQGGNGIVYKGLLPSDKVVAIKKSKTFDQRQVKQFINEVCLLTQINHRHVVKLLGCCLQTEVPLLVYEFVKNGTLYHHIHDDSLSSSLSWEKRLKIAIEAAGALAYLHFEASMPIIHRDVKSANILLDDNLIAKVADFGASRLISVNEKQATTLVQGTYGYLDPESFQTGQLTEKSDVYSFGVILVELLTSKKVIFWDDIGIERNLALYFVSAMKENRLLQVLDPYIINEDNIEELKNVANLGKRCLSVTGEDRPSMKEVVMELEGLRIIKKHPLEKIDLSSKETMNLLTEPTDVGIGCSSSYASVGYDSIIKHDLEELDEGR